MNSPLIYHLPTESSLWYFTEVVQVWNPCNYDRKPFACCQTLRLSFVLNQSRSRLLYFCLVGRGKLPLIRQLCFPVLLLAKLLLCLLLSRLLARRLRKSFSLGPKASVKAKDLIQLKSRISAALNMRLRLGDHIVP